MGIEENKRLVVKFIGHYEKAEYEDAIDMIADDGQWWLPGHPAEFPAAGYVDKATVKARLSGNLKLLPNGIRFEHKGITAEGDRVALELESFATMSNGAAYHNRYHFLFVVRDGKFVLVKEYLDTLHSKLALGAARAAAAQTAQGQ